MTNTVLIKTSSDIYSLHRSYEASSWQVNCNFKLWILYAFCSYDFSKVLQSSHSWVHYNLALRMPCEVLPERFLEFSRYLPNWVPTSWGRGILPPDCDLPTYACRSTLRGSTLAPSPPHRTSPYDFCSPVLTVYLVCIQGSFFALWWQVRVVEPLWQSLGHV